jgi:hypothetical protein
LNKISKSGQGQHSGYSVSWLNGEVSKLPCVYVGGKTGGVGVITGFFWNSEKLKSQNRFHNLLYSTIFFFNNIFSLVYTNPQWICRSSMLRLATGFTRPVLYIAQAASMGRGVKQERRESQKLKYTYRLELGAYKYFSRNRPFR